MKMFPICHIVLYTNMAISLYVLSLLSSNALVAYEYTGVSVRQNKRNQQIRLYNYVIRDCLLYVNEQTTPKFLQICLFSQTAVTREIYES